MRIQTWFEPQSLPLLEWKQRWLFPTQFIEASNAFFARNCWEIFFSGILGSFLSTTVISGSSGVSTAEFTETKPATGRWKHREIIIICELALTVFAIKRGQNPGGKCCSIGVGAGKRLMTFHSLMSLNYRSQVPPSPFRLWFPLKWRYKFHAKQ